MADENEPGEIAIAGDGLSAAISPLGAELRILRDAAGRDLLWDGDPAVWSGRSPLLFPIVGGLAGGRYRLDGQNYELPRHGFARRRRFALLEQAPAAATFRLEADEETRAAYPFAFRLDMRYAIAAATIRLEATVANLGDTAMPASFGFHPALRWPLPYGAPRADHRIRFGANEPTPIRRLDTAGLVDPRLRPSPIAGDTLALDDDLFVEDAIILDRPASRSLLYGAAAGPQLRIDYPDMPMLGLWSKPGAGFLCIEPWQGFADPAGFDADLFAKPGIVIIPPAGRRTFAMSITLLP
ncbi:aldose 1-epimerase family protein [Sphingomonas profundi]|uniref:aldose 1-epimerase family protein n=1 Tax=Alterirhizorhabdus profundi TaxID=2681549 RepID=UPI0012E8B340|nr:aldose 1-epimerase family protein [Sphingomonas profundi]